MQGFPKVYMDRGVSLACPRLTLSKRLTLSERLTLSVARGVVSHHISLLPHAMVVSWDGGLMDGGLMGGQWKSNGRAIKRH